MNPIMQMLNGRSRLNEVMNLVKALQNNDPDKIMAEMTRENAQFRDFVNKYRNTKPEDILRENGVNPDILNSIR